MSNSDNPPTLTPAPPGGVRTIVYDSSGNAFMYVDGEFIKIELPNN